MGLSDFDAWELDISPFLVFGCSVENRDGQTILGNVQNLDCGVENTTLCTIPKIAFHSESNQRSGCRTGRHELELATLNAKPRSQARTRDSDRSIWRPLSEGGIFEATDIIYI